MSREADCIRNRELKKRWRTEGKCINCGSPNDCLPKTLCSKCVPKLAAAMKRWHLNLRREAFNAYGGPQCACCDTLVDEFLTLDHVGGGGAAHRATLRGSMQKPRTDGGGGVKLY